MTDKPPTGYLDPKVQNEQRKQLAVEALKARLGNK